MEERLSTYLKQQAETVISRGEDLLLIHDGSPLAIEKIKSCENIYKCLDYATKDIGLTWTWFGEAFLVNYCCEECRLYKSK